MHPADLEASEAAWAWEPAPVPEWDAAPMRGSVASGSVDGGVGPRGPPQGPMRLSANRQTERPRVLWSLAQIPSSAGPTYAIPDRIPLSGARSSRCFEFGFNYWLVNLCLAFGAPSRSEPPAQRRIAESPLAPGFVDFDAQKEEVAANARVIRDKGVGTRGSTRASARAPFDENPTLNLRWACCPPLRVPPVQGASLTQRVGPPCTSLTSSRTPPRLPHPYRV